MTESRGDLAIAVRAKLAAGTLPRTAPTEMWVGNGKGRPCDVCDQPITRAEIEYEPEFGRRASGVRFHQACLEVWHRERLRHSGSATGASTVRAKIREAIRLHRDKALCTSCLTILTGAPSRVVEEAVRRIEGDVEFQRFHGPCGICGRNRLVIAVRSPNAPASAS